MLVDYLPPAESVVPPPPFAGPDHPMRKVTRGVAFDNMWDAERAQKVAALFDSMAADWTSDHDSPERRASLTDALERGDVAHGATLEVGSGTGLGTGLLRQLRQGPIVALDLAAEMLRVDASSRHPPRPNHPRPTRYVALHPVCQRNESAKEPTTLADRSRAERGRGHLPERMKTVGV